MQNTRLRYLLAMGLVACANRDARSSDGGPSVPADAGPFAASQGDTPDSAPRTTTPTPVATSPVETVQTADEGVVRADAGAGTWVVGPAPRPRDPMRAEPPGRATCPSGEFCVTASPPVKGPAAPAPYADCAATASHPSAGDIPHFNPTRTGSERKGNPNACCYSWYRHCPGGRPLRDGDRAVVADATPRNDWTRHPSNNAPLSVDGDTRARLAAHWLREAAAEHASIASFQRFGLQLLSLGAPSELLAAAVDAARDEILHAELCYGLAARYGGAAVGPAPLALPGAPIPTDPAAIALETLRDGCLGETLASQVARHAASCAADHAVREALTRIADDEDRHAILAWRTVAWLVTQHGARVRDAVHAFAEELAAAERTSDATPARADHAGELAHGVLDASSHRACATETIHAVVLPCLRALLSA